MSYRASGAERAVITDVVPFPVEILGDHGRLVPIDGGRSAMLVPTGSMLGSALRLDVSAGREPNALRVHGRFTPIPLFFAMVAQVSFIAFYIALAMGDETMLGYSLFLTLPLLAICGRTFLVTRRGFAWAVELTEARLAERHPEAPAEEEAPAERAPAAARARLRDRVRVADASVDDPLALLADDEALTVERKSRAAKRRRARAARTDEPDD